MDYHLRMSPPLGLELLPLPRNSHCNRWHKCRTMPCSRISKICRCQCNRISLQLNNYDCNPNLVNSCLSSLTLPTCHRTCSSGLHKTQRNSNSSYRWRSISNTNSNLHRHKHTHRRDRRLMHKLVYNRSFRIKLNILVYHNYPIKTPLKHNGRLPCVTYKPLNPPPRHIRLLDPSLNPLRN